MPCILPASRRRASRWCATSSCAKKAQCSLSYGLYDGDRLLGYLLAWVENTRIEGRREPVILVDDVCLRPEARGRLFALFAALRQGIDEGGWGRLALESAARSQAENLYVEHPRVIERLGFRLTHRARYYSEAIGEELTWMRYTPISSVDSVASRDDLELSPEMFDDEESAHEGIDAIRAFLD